jgi:hypothetical protein
MTFEDFNAWVVANPNAMSLIEWITNPVITTLSNKDAPSFFELIAEITPCKQCAPCSILAHIRIRTSRGNRRQTSNPTYVACLTTREFNIVLSVAVTEAEVMSLEKRYYHITSVNNTGKFTPLTLKRFTYPLIPTSLMSSKSSTLSFTLNCMFSQS